MGLSKGNLNKVLFGSLKNFNLEVLLMSENDDSLNRNINEDYQLIEFKDRTKEPVKFRGVPVTLQNMKVIMPPLNFAAFVDHDALVKIDRIKDVMLNSHENNSCNISKECLNDLIELITLAIQRNYPDISQEEIKAGLDFGNMQEIMGQLVVQNPTLAVKNTQRGLEEQAGKNLGK